MSDDAGPAQVYLARIRLRREICDLILHALDDDAPINDVVNLADVLGAWAQKSSRAAELAPVIDGLDAAVEDGIVAMLKSDRYMDLIEHKDRWLEIARARRPDESDDDWRERLRVWGIDE